MATRREQKRALGNHTSWLDWAILQMAVPRPI